jgi:hypothetical protein
MPPIPNAAFYYSPPLATHTLQQFLNPQLSIECSQSLSCNAFLVVLESIYARITSFRRKSESLNMKVFDPMSGGHLLQEYQIIRNDMELLYHRLPDFVKAFDQNIFPSTWNSEYSEWIVLNIIYHSTFASLHGSQFI